MRESRSRVRLSWLLGTIMLAAAGCAAGGPRGAAFTRRGAERDFISSPVFGAPRGLTFADIIPVGARITTVHVGVDGERVTSMSRFALKLTLLSCGLPIRPSSIH